MEIFKQHRLSDSIILAEVDKFPDDVYRKQLSEWLLTDYPFLQWRELLPDAEQTKLKSMGENLSLNWKLRVGLFVEGELRGWSFGWQDSADSYYMGASAVATAGLLFLASLLCS